MAEPLADQIIPKIRQAEELYYRLILVVAPAGAGKTLALREVKQRIGAPLINVNLELSRGMLDLTERQRVLQLPRILGKIVNEADSTVVLLDNTEILFDGSLKQDPLRLLQGLSRNRTVVVSWNGEIRSEGRGPRTESEGSFSLLTAESSSFHLVYATPDHPEYRRYPIRDFLVVTPQVTA
ncbi:MAG: BREX-3 system P-loop-containing protein BrxF [Candidatus Latescibacterota bacterium]